jgi:pentatricopeptide repeat protein
MQAWATSKLPEAAENLARLEQYMRKHMIRLNGIHYSILLRFWGTQRDTDKLDELFRQMMEFEKIMPNIVTYDGALLGYAQCDKITKARWCLEGMIQYKPNHPQKHQHRRIHRKKRMNAENDKILIAEGAYQILLAYRRASLKSKVIVNEAKEFYDYIALHVSPDWIGKYMIVKSCGYRDAAIGTQPILLLHPCKKAKSTGVMVDIYSQCGNHEEADKLKKCIKVSGRALRHVVKLYTKKNMADQATTTWKQSLENGAEPTLESLNTILAAWARSRQRDSFDRALEILRFVETDPQCNQFFLRPDETSFQSLLLCLARSKNGKGQYVMEILEEMGRRKHLGDQSVHLNEATRSLAIQACIRMGDLRSAEEILRQTETSETPPSTRMYNSILKVLHGSVPAAERAEQILAVMKQSPRTQPDIHTYTIVLNAWTKANDTYAFSRAWKFYEQMRSDGIQPNHVTFSLLFTCFCQRKNPTRENLERADILLQHMADSDHMRPHNRHFTALIKAWLCIGEVDHALRLLMLSVEFRVNDQVPEAAPVTPIIDAILNAFIERGDIDKAIFVAEKMSGLQEAKLTPDGPSIAMLQSLVALWSKQEKCHIDYYYYDDDVDPKTIKTSMLVQKIERRILDWQIQEDDTELRRFDAYQSKQ